MACWIASGDAPGVLGYEWIAAVRASQRQQEAASSPGFGWTQTSAKSLSSPHIGLTTISFAPL